MYFMERISEHITHKEAVRSNTALRLNLKNIPDDYQVSNMVGIATHVFEPLREYVGGPIKINSMFKKSPLNEINKNILKLPLLEENTNTELRK